MSIHRFECSSKTFSNRPGGASSSGEDSGDDAAPEGEDLVSNTALARKVIRARGPRAAETAATVMGPEAMRRLLIAAKERHGPPEAATTPAPTAELPLMPIEPVARPRGAARLAADPQEEVEQRSRAAASAAARVATAAAEEEVQAARERAKRPRHGSEVMLGMVEGVEAADLWGLLGLRSEAQRSDEAVEWAAAARREALEAERFGGDEGLMRRAETALRRVNFARAILLDCEYRRVYESMGSGDGFAEQGRQFSRWLEESARWQAEPLARLQLTWVAQARREAEERQQQREQQRLEAEARAAAAAKAAAAADAAQQELRNQLDDQGHGLGTPAERQQHRVEQHVAEGSWGEGQQREFTHERSEAGEEQQRRAKKGKGHEKREKKRKRAQQAGSEAQREEQREGDAMDEE